MRSSLAALVLAALLLAACTPAGQRTGGEANRKIRIGLSLDSLQEERWQRDRDMFVAHARSLGAEVIVQAAGRDDYLQIAQAENMISRGIDVLVIVPHNAAALAPVVEIAHRAGVKVIAYDRLITYADVDFYVSFDSERVGELQAEYLVRRVPKGNYVYIGGAPTDHNAYLLRRGTERVLEQYRRSGDITLVFSDMTPEWRPDEARRMMDAGLQQAQGRVDAVIAANDSTAGGAIEALQAWGLAGRVPVAGQDADLAAVRRIVEGTQAMTVYKPIRLLATRAAEAAVAMARGRAPEANGTVDNGKRSVPSFLIQPVAVDQANIRETLVRDGFHREEDVFGKR